MFRSVAPVFAVQDIAAAAAHYRRLGFSVELYEGPEAYAFAARDAVELHLHAVPEFDEAAVGSVMYLRVDDADALWQEWQGSNGRLVPPENTPYGLREGAHVDPDGNLIRFGSPLTVTAP